MPLHFDQRKSRGPTEPSKRPPSSAPITLPPGPYSFPLLPLASSTLTACRSLNSSGWLQPNPLNELFSLPGMVFPRFLSGPHLLQSLLKCYLPSHTFYDHTPAPRFTCLLLYFLYNTCHLLIAYIFIVSLYRKWKLHKVRECHFGHCCIPVLDP